MKTLIAANWKMHKTRAEARETTAELVSRLGGKAPEGREVLIFPPFTAIADTAAEIGGAEGFAVGAQNFYPAEKGAFTGEVSPAMLADAGCTVLLAGHSERRHVLNESDALVGRKVAFGLAGGFAVVLCVGETIAERKAGKVEEVLARQLEAGLADAAEAAVPERFSVAYEPVWAIGTGEVAGPDEIAHAHGYVRAKLVELLGERGASVRILYGGSVTPEGAAGILALDNVEGVLVGGASLKADSFARIALA